MKRKPNNPHVACAYDSLAMCADICWKSQPKQCCPFEWLWSWKVVASYVLKAKYFLSSGVPTTPQNKIIRVLQTLYSR